MFFKFDTNFKKILFANINGYRHIENGFVAHSFLGINLYVSKQKKKS